MYQLSNPQRLIYEMEKYVGGAVAIICGSVLLEGQRDPANLIQAVNEIFRRNEALRTRIMEQEGKISQEIEAFREQPINVLRFDGKDAFTAYAEKYAQTPVKLNGPLCEIQVVLLPEHCGLLAKCHHLIGDAWTLTLIASQLCALLAGEEPPAYPYSDFVESEAAYAQSSRREKDKAFFLEQFKACPEVVYLSEKPGDCYAACRSTFQVNADLTAQLRSYAKAHNTSPFVLFLTAFAIYFSRIKDNAEQFYIGTPILNRRNFREKHTMGMFINTVPVLAHVDYNHSFSENLGAMQRETLAVLRHQKFHYNEILAAIRQEYGFTEKLYDVILSYQNAAVAGAEQEVETTWYHSGTQTESLQIHIDDRDSKGVFRVHLDYRTDKFTASEIQKMYGHILNLLQDAISHDEKTPEELALLSLDEEQLLFHDFNDTAADYPRNKCVHTLFEEQVERTPDRTALIWGDRSFSYEELNSMANGLAWKLKDSGVKHGDIVAILAKRSYKLVVAILAVLKAGGAYLPVDYNYPPERIDKIIFDSGCKIILTYGVKYPGKNVIRLEQELYGKTNPENSNETKDICAVIYTSGSTGQPKGTLICHQGLTNYTYANDALYSGGSCVIGFSTYTFDAFFLDTIPPMLRGVPAVMATESQQFQQADFEKLIIKNPNCNLFITPAKLKVFFDNRLDAHFFDNVHNICIGGEIFPKEFLSLLPSSTNVFNVYGPTECSMWTLEAKIAEADITIGKPIANTQIYIVDKYMVPVPMGVTGELCIAGDGVGAGYLNRPELTAEKFIDNPFGPGKLYKTGDLAYWREDGNIVYVGRNDFQVKIRGLRVELGEIESVIAGVDGVSQAVVVVRKDDTGRQLICAFYTEIAPVELEAVKSALRDKLPRYMMPHIFTRLDALPMTTSGKVNRKALPEVDLSALASEVEYAAPATEQETALVSAVTQVLGVERVGMRDNFFDLGGDSLKAIELTSVLERDGYHTEIKTIFEAEALGELAAKLTVVHIGADAVIPAGDIPATAAQMRVYTAQSISGGTAYNVPYAFKVEELNPDRLQAAVDCLVARHEILRTRFENRDGVIMQVVDDSARCQVGKLSSDDLSVFIYPFDLEAAPLLRVGYCGNTVLLDMHHIITDGGSMPIFLRELNSLYMGRDLVDTPVQYRAFAAQAKIRSEDEAYWLSVFADEPPILEMNTDFPRQGKQSFEGAAIYQSIAAALHKKICAKSKAMNITPYVYYMGSFYVLLSKFSGNEDIVVGTPSSGRNGKFLNTMGMFVNTLALRSRPEGAKTVRDYFREVKAAAVGALAHQNYPYGDLVKRLGIHPEGRNPLFDVMFAYQSEKMTQVVFGDAPAELLPVPVTSSKYDFTFNVMPREVDVVLMVEYCTVLFKETTIQRLIEGYRLLLEQMLDETKPLRDLTAITDQERHVLLHDFNDTAVDYPRDKCVHTLFEEQVKRTPDKTAVIACDRTLTYRELNEEANRIAHGLMEQGVKPGDIVAFALPRNSHLISAIFGILKAGAAYLPIDPDYPQDRINHMLRDSAAQHFLTKKDIAQLLETNFTANPGIYIPGESMYCIIYTSGSTGNPKGCILTHRGVCNFCVNNNVIRYFKRKGLAPIGISLNNVTFDYFIAENIVLLTHGAVTVLCDEDQSILPIHFWDLCVLHKVNLIQTTPTKYRIMLESPECTYLKNVALLVTSGEPLTNELLETLHSYTSAEVFNPLGPSETTVWAPNGEYVDGEDIHIGKPLGNTQVYIVDKYMIPTPIGVTGELCIAGDGVGAGYLNRPELTAEKFIPNPFGKGKLYKTGDLAYWREDGNIAYVGRNDFQVKIRGLRIELGEIENAIAGVDGVNQTVVVVRKDKTGRQLICAFYTETAPVKLEAIKAALWEKLPRYMMPHIFTRLDSLPMTTSGKVNRKALPEVDLSNPERNIEYLLPEGETEKQLASIMEVVLNYSPIGRDDNFFDLGGDSLKAIEFLSKAHSDGLYFSLQNVFDYPTVRQLHQCMEEGDKLSVSYEDADFSQINELLAKNHLGETVPPVQNAGNILLAGATSFLGIHILADYLEHDNGTAYCLVRGQNQEESNKRLTELLDFYFEDKYTNQIGSRIQVLCGDLQKDGMGLESQEYKSLLDRVDTVINAAASVKHYGSYRYFHEVNVETVGRLIPFCRNRHAKLIHISTLSVSGNSFGDDFNGYISEIEKQFYESDLYIGQPLENVYARSKFEAEKLVLEAALDGLPVHIMRMGNLTNRQSDGVFQINHQTNAAAQRIKGIVELGIVPDYLVNDDMYVEFTPIDEAAQAIMLLVRHFDPERTVFHINSTKVAYLYKLMDYFSAVGYPLRVVPGDEFTTVLRETAKQSGMEHIFETFINDLDKQDHLNYDSNIRIKNTYTEEYLRRLGFAWGEIGLEYFKKYSAYFRKIGYWRG